MRKLTIAGLTIILGIACFVTYKHAYPQIIRSDSDYSLYSLGEMESLATVIVEAEFAGETASVVPLDQQDQYPIEANTFSQIKIKKIYKGQEHVGTSSRLNVIEHYGKWTNLWGSYQRMPNEVYKPLSPGRTYLLFLYKGPTQPAETYEIIGNHQGKFAIQHGNKALDNLTIANLDIQDDDQAYRDLYRDVAEKYKLN
ncbi:hypothetical protein [Paenibacillus radicis (ex Gao et al. 2016)]|uniref:Uncharacterized protein n=1 Tax=Paenibacillus radicis (ex Gao et al. 2016) TaxID=1737354 RepID=A0A917GSB7_9BACL|nr:hypothetical protein [Paenibacillus radicis (ex Gao et al. 2016)]GGG55132.1 hypothetical protein GCM10010918_04960 [Paenibacillus radicis (ex Gao et al. 2016)]